MSFQTPDMDYVMELEASNNMTSTMSPNSTGVFVRYTWTAFLATFYPMALSVDRYVTPVLLFYVHVCNKQMKLANMLFFVCHRRLSARC